MKFEGFCFDAEADNLYLQSKKIWYIRFKDLNSDKSMKVYPFRESLEEVQDKIIEWLETYEDNCIVAGWNILGYDLWLLWKLLGIQPRCGKEGKDWWAGKPVQFIDGFVLSMYLNPNQPKHSLEYVSGGEENADGKIDYRNSLIRAGAMPEDAPKGYEFSFWHKLMEPYCDRDVDASIKAIKKLWRQGAERYGEDKWLHKSFRQMQKDFWLYSAQAYTGILFNQERALALQEEIQSRMLVLKNEVDPVLPKRPLKTAEQPFYKQPAKPFNKDGTHSANLLKFLDKHKATLEDGMIKAYGLEVKLEANAILPVKLPMEIEDGIELKDYFLENGWVPSDDYWNFQKGPDGKNLRDANNKFIRTTPKINHAGQLCPNLLKLDGEIPAKVVKFLSLRNRLGVVTGWLNNWRIPFDGRLSAEISGYAPTSRVKHRVVVNCPKADPKVLLGAEMRDLFVVEKGYWYIGSDASALENRTLSHYTFKYDEGAFAKLQTEGDPHCYSEDTEILTPSGWKTFGDLSSEDLVAQWDNGEISFVKPSHIIWQDYEGEMVNVKNNVLDFLVTPGHRVVLRQYKSGNVSVKLAKDLKNNNSGQRIPLAGKTLSGGLDLEDDQIRFIVAVQADSYKTDKSFRFEFVKERKIIRLKNILNNLGIPFSESYGVASLSGKTTTRISVSRKYCQFINKGITDAKKFSNNLLSMNSHQCTVFTDEVALWDGTVTNLGDTVLDTTCEVSCNMVATIASLCGRKATRSIYPNKQGSLGNCTIHRCYISKPSLSLGAAVLSATISKQFYKGKIGCVSVPSTFVLVKRNNCIFVSGNSFNAFAFFPHLHKEFDISNQENKEDPRFKTWRNKSKTGSYLLAFGGGAPKLASSLGLSKEEGKKAYDNYWKQNKGLGLLKESVEKYFETTGNKKFIPAIDGRLVSVRGKNVLLSCLGQGLGAIAMSYAACLMDTWLGDFYLDDLGRPYYLYEGKVVKRVSMFHDEYSWEVQEGCEEVIREISVKAIIKAGEILGLALPLNGEGKKSFEGSWKDVH